MANALCSEEKAIFFDLWNAHRGVVGSLFREVRGGVQSIKVIGRAYITNGRGSVEVTGLRGHFHPCKKGGQKAIHIESIRVNGKWAQDRELIHTELRLSENGSEAYIVSWI